VRGKGVCEKTKG